MSNAMMHSDPTEAAAASETAAAASCLEGTSSSGPDESWISGTSGGSGLYTSSVEMVTTPETYPLWRTRTPVIVVLNRRHSTIKQRVQHHYYRYLVIAPGMGNNSTSIHESSAQHNMLTVSTSSEYMGSTIVRQWEDPYLNSTTTDPTTADTPSTSFVSDAATSVASFVSQNKDGTEHGMFSTWNDYLNLPYRTLDIDLTQLGQVSVQSQQPPPPHAMDTTGSGDSSTHGTGHIVTVPLDTWNDADDASFQPYLIREAVRARNSDCPVGHTPKRAPLSFLLTHTLLFSHRSMWKIAKK
jgi:hypothetical protein